jgi:hypothetical protein
MINRFYVEKRGGSFNGWADHVVKDSENDGAVLCASTDYLCEGIARTHNIALTPLADRFKEALEDQ